MTSLGETMPTSLSPSMTRTRPAALPAFPLLCPGCGGQEPSDECQPHATLRRSGREFRSDLLPLWLLGQLLWAAQGITGPGGKRAAPSAGALYPLELYVVEPAAILHYLPAGHRVERRSDVDRRPELEAAAFGQDFVGSAPVVVVIVAVVERTRRRYGAVAADLVNREAGHAAQNLLLEATAHGLAAVPVGGLDPRAVEVALALPPGHEAVYMIPVGYPAGSG